ncbi:MAG: DNA mismatch repair endonuclease MutL [Spirochaetaceae bacterium]|jgi:DNA mismatch repair protein MutL|nr:DNA mismatch repair endonuclease MutL [Spirochaetaceae bacterium]
MIRILPPAEAQKIAAGEVIERPAALVREFIDNALDAGAGRIELSIESGGMNKVEVIDDGRGMDRADLELCVQSHATSKIQSLDDLSRSTTLGFRGEALAAAAAVARLEILTGTGGGEAWLLDTGTGETRQSRRTRGTSVRAFGLFAAIPARRRFLKREAGETALCRQVLVEKALAFPGVSFRFAQDGVLKLHLLPRTEPAPEGPEIPAGGAPESAAESAGSAAEPAGLKNRFAELLLSGGEGRFLHTVEAEGRGFTVTVIFGGPELYRQDRRQQYIFANRRRIQDFGLMQALEYGLQGFFPNGSHPLGAVFVEVDPALADFNVHPAKREVRFADSGAIHHAVSSALREYAGRTVPAGGAFSAARGPEESELNFGSPRALAMTALLERRNDFAPLPGTRPYNPPEGAYGVYEGDLPDTVAEPAAAYGSPRLIGRAFGLFIIVEKGERLFLIDQHAAHERLLYNHFLAGPVTTQELLVAIPFTTGSAGEDSFLQTRREELAKLGIVLESEGGGTWRIEALPAGWKLDDGETVKNILSLRDAGENIAERWAATASCKAAIKDGGYLDDAAALAMAEAALALGKNGSLPRCPHGRPLWVELSREDLYKAVRRTE